MFSMLAHSDFSLLKTGYQKLVTFELIVADVSLGESLRDSNQLQWDVITLQWCSAWERYARQ